ncbi:TRAP transporter small permease [Alteribacter natronophilus]|uniref:TRAP transporter small permease n=1 Tax=Alteribacter natronophilus TaxID=2583810 RepID=UPI00110F6618|nr:TRAP transporter small permease [Alteribacter natronophilus]TMW72511.1 TRAP transporter small permease [Alteribacter natronophilus]
MNVIKKADNLLQSAEKLILSWAIIIIAVMVVGNVLSREITGRSWAFSQEISLLAVVAATFMGISYAARKGRHITMSAFFDLAPKRVKKALSIINPLITAIVLFVFAYFAFQYTMFNYNTGQTTSSLRFPIWIMTAFVPLGFMLGGIQFLRNMWINIVNEEVYLAQDKKDYD